MSKGNKEEQKWLLGESLNQYDRSLKEELNKVEKRNREQNHKISALINAFDDDYIKKEEENTNISLDYSKEGIVIVDDIKGNTLVNNVKDSNKELVLNGDIDTQGINNVTLEGTVDNGKVDVSLEGNTEINLSKTKDPIMITHKFDDINSNNGKLQTTVNGTTTVNDSPGKVDIKEITGDTLINHVSNGSEELTLNGDIDTSGYNNVTLTEGINGGKVDVMCEGNTMVNVCDQEKPVAITKNYEVTTGNHVALQGEYDGKCRPNIYGNTLVNLWDIKSTEINGQVVKTDTTIKIKTTDNVYSNFFIRNKEMFKPSTEYTFIINVIKNTLVDDSTIRITSIADGTNRDIFNNSYGIQGGKTGIFIVKLTTIADFSQANFGVRSFFNNPSKTSNCEAELNIIILEGDYTNTPISDYFTGMKSSFEDKYIPENLYKFSSRDDFYLLDDNATLDGEYIEMTANSAYQNAMLKPLGTIKPSTTYTIVVDVVQNTLNSMLFITNGSDNTQLPVVSLFQVNAGRTGIFTRVVTTNDDLSGCTRCLVNYLDETNTTGNIKYRIMVVEGDYTNYDFTDYDSTKGGKYKVDYKVTGKNKCRIKDGNYTNDVNTNGLTWTIKDNQVQINGTSTGMSSLGTSMYYPKFINGKTYVTSTNNSNVTFYISYIDNGTKKYSGGGNKTYTHNSNYTDIMCYLQVNNSGITFNNEVIKCQLEEGDTATTYEPYKEFTKTLYLNSPLLEGDTIEQSGNDIVHMHRYKTVTFDGSSDESWGSNGNDRNIYYKYMCDSKTDAKTKALTSICDKLPTISMNKLKTGIIENTGTGKIQIGCTIDKLSEFKSWLQQNPITVAYELANPTREVISTNDNLLLDSYVNGHLDVDSVVPIDKVAFKTYGRTLKYLSPNTEYTIQFESDNNGILYGLNLNYNDSLTNLNIVKGINKFNITTIDTIRSNYLWTNGIGFNMSKVVVTPKVDEDFGYFKGMKSVGECEGNVVEVVAQNKNLWNPIIDNNTNNYKCEATYSNEILTVKGTGDGTNECYTRYNNSSYFILQHLKPNTSYYFSYESDGEFGSQNGTDTIEAFIFGSFGHGLKYSIPPQGATFKTDNKGIVIFRFDVNKNDMTHTFYNFMLTEGTTVSTYTAHKENKQTITHEPLRGLPNGTKDKYVIIDGKWYIERNCAELVVNTSSQNFVVKYWNGSFDTDNLYAFFIASDKVFGTYPNGLKYQVLKPIICDKFPYTESGTASVTFGVWSGLSSSPPYIGFKLPKNIIDNCEGESILEKGKNYLNSIGDIKFIVQYINPTYEPIDYNPFEVYTDITHISNNSIIPCNMVIKNSGYNTISLKENTKYTAYVNNKNNISLTYKLDNNAIAVNSSNKFTFTTPSTLVDRTIRIASKGSKIQNLMIVEGTPQNDPIGYFDGLKSSYECEKVTDVNDEYYNKYKVDVRVEGENFESTQTVYLNSPLLKGDKIIWKDNKLQHYHKMKTIVFDGSDDENWQRQQILDTKNTERYFISDNTVKPKSSLISDVLPTEKLEIDNLTYLYVHNIEKRFDIKKLKTDTRWNDVTTLKKWLQQNPITVVYELATPYYEEISEYPLKFNSIANCSLSTVSNIQVSNISFNIYEETLPYLYNTTKYYITFNSDISKEIIIDLGGSELVYTTKVGFNKVEITTPDNSNNMLTFNGQGVNINSVKVTQQNIDDYFEGMKSVGECEDLEVVSSNKDNTLSNKQTMTHEPLRGLPNGTKDKYVIIDGKWYIERNIAKLVIDSNCNPHIHVSTDLTTTFRFYVTLDMTNFNTVNYGVDTTLCDNVPFYKGNYYNRDVEHYYIESRKVWVFVNRNKCNPTDKDLSDYLSTNTINIIVTLNTPIYEPIDYNPFEVYSDITHISNNSIIPANMVIKNSGYNCILKPNTKYTVVTNTQGSISAKIGSTKVNSTNNVFTIITPSTLTDNVLRFSGKGLTTKDIMLLEGDKTNYIPEYFTGMESAFEQELVTDEKDKNYGKYKVNVKATNPDNSQQNNITFYLKEPLRGVGDVKDKVYVKEDKVVVERNCVSYVLDSTQIPSWASSSNGIYTYNLSVNSPIVNTSWGKVVCNSLPCDVKNAHNRNYANTISTVVDKSVPDGVIRIITDKDPETLKQWLQANPTTVVYQLATPVYEEVECDLSKLMLENYENSSLILNSNIPPTVNVRYKGELPIVSATKELSSNVESTTTDINQNIIPYMCDMDYRIVELQLKNASTQGLEVNVLGLDSEDVLFNNRKANKIFNPSYEMLKRDILSKRYSSDEYRYRLERYLLADKISNEEYNELEELINGR